VNAGTLLALALAPAAPAGKDSGGGDTAALQGAWAVEAYTMGGLSAPAVVLADMAVTIDGDVLKAGPTPAAIYRAGGGVVWGLDPGPDFRLKVDPTARPRRVDLRVDTPDGPKAYPGIYRVDGDRLTVCYATGGDRPAEFRAGAGSARVLVELGRRER
jgi:uncharacterized protein (TIGR03067 family)